MTKQESLFQNTYRSLTDRIRPCGYAPTSVTGAYPGMFPRDASIQVLTHVQCEDFEPALRILRYLFRYHKHYGYKYALHMILEDAPPFSDKVQTDTTFFLLRAWCAYFSSAPNSPQKQVFFDESIQQVYAFADYFFSDAYFSTEKQLLRNPSLEGPRLHSYFNCYDLLTNVCASQALYELAQLLSHIDPERSSGWQHRADLLSEGVHKHLTAEVDGKQIYMEMHCLDRQDGHTLLTEPHHRSYVGFGWVSLFPLGVHWYAARQEILANTYSIYKKYATVVYFDRWPMLEGETEYQENGVCTYQPRRVLGKALAWELIYCRDIGDQGRVTELLEFIASNSDDMYRENWHITGGGGDTANQEHASWMVYAVQYIHANG